MTSIAGSNKLAPFLPSSKNVLANLVSLLGTICPQDVFLDLGCGDAQVLIHIAKAYGCKCIGIEYDSIMVERANQNIKSNGLEDLVTVRHEDICKVQTIPDVTVVFLFLSVQANSDLRTLLSSCYENDCKIISNMFSLGYLGEPVQNLLCDNITYLYLYEKVPIEEKIIENVADEKKEEEEEDSLEWVKDLFDPLKNPLIIGLFHFSMAALTIILFVCIALDLGNIHIYNMGAIGICLWISVTWFMKEFRAAVEREEAEKEQLILDKKDQ